MQQIKRTLHLTGRLGHGQRQPGACHRPPQGRQGLDQIHTTTLSQLQRHFLHGLQYRGCHPLLARYGNRFGQRQIADQGWLTRPDLAEQGDTRPVGLHQLLGHARLLQIFKQALNQLVTDFLRRNAAEQGPDFLGFFDRTGKHGPLVMNQILIIMLPLAVDPLFHIQTQLLNLVLLFGQPVLHRRRGEWYLLQARQVKVGRGYRHRGVRQAATGRADRNHGKLTDHSAMTGWF